MIRVLRVIEYVYNDFESYIEDKKRWTTSFNTGSNAPRKMAFSSAVVAEDVVKGNGLNWWNDATETNETTS